MAGSGGSLGFAESPLAVQIVWHCISSTPASPNLELSLSTRLSIPLSVCLSGGLPFWSPAVSSNPGSPACGSSTKLCPEGPAEGC